MNVGLRHTHCGQLRNNVLFSNQGVDQHGSKKSGDGIRSFKPCLKLDDIAVISPL